MIPTDDSHDDDRVHGNNSNDSSPPIAIIQETCILLLNLIESINLLAIFLL